MDNKSDDAVGMRVSTRVYAGRVLAHGEAPYNHDPKEKTNYFVKLDTQDGEKTVWGIDLKRAMADRRAKVGDDVQLEHKGNQPVTVEALKRDDKGTVVGLETIDTQRNTWDVHLADHNKVAEVLSPSATDEPTQRSDGARKVSPQDTETKIGLIKRLFPKVDSKFADNIADKIASIDVKENSGRVILHFHEEDRVDFDPTGERVRQFGIGAHAKALAMAIADSTLARFFQHPDDDWGRAKKPSSAVKLSVMSREDCDIIADAWQQRGFENVSSSPRGVLVEISAVSWLLDRGNEAMLRGQTTEDAIVALMMKASADWGGRIELIGSDDYKLQAWQIAQQVGVTVVGYEPPEAVLNGGRNPNQLAQPDQKSQPEPKADESIQAEAQPSLNAQNVEKNAKTAQNSVATTSASVVSVIGLQNDTLSSAKGLDFSALLNAANDDTYDIDPFNDDSPSP